MFLPGRSRHTTHTLVRAREGLQCARHGPPWPQPWRPLQLLLQAVYHEDGPHAGRPDDREDRVCPQQELHPPRHQARQLPDGDRAALQQAVPDRLWSCQEVPRQQDAATHPLQRGQEPHRHCQVKNKIVRFLERKRIQVVDMNLAKPFNSWWWQEREEGANWLACLIALLPWGNCNFGKVLWQAMQQYVAMYLDVTIGQDLGEHPLSQIQLCLHNQRKDAAHWAHEFPFFLKKM